MLSGAPSGRLDRTDLAIAVVIGIVVAVVARIGLTAYHGWGDDFAGYVLQARAIASGNTLGEMGLNRTLLRASDGGIGPAAYPPGFPVLLALAAQIGGWGMISLKMVGVVSLAVTTAFAFLLSRSLLPRPISIVAASFVGLQPQLLRSADALESDLPFLALVTVALFVIDRVHRRIESTGRAAVGLSFIAAALTACSVSVRSNGVLLGASFVAISAYLWQSAPRLRRAIVVSVAVYGGVLLAVATAYYLRFPDSGVRQAATVAASGHAGFVAARMHAIFMTARATSAFFPFSLFSRDSSQTAAAATVALVVAFGFVVVGTWARRPYSSILAVSGLFNLVLLVVLGFSIVDRYAYPLVVPAVVLGLAGVERVWAMVCAKRQLRVPAQAGQWVAAALILVMGGLAYTQTRTEPVYAVSGPYSENTRGLSDFLVRNVPVDARISFFKPRALRLVTGRQVIRVTKAEHVDRAAYFVIDKRTSDGRREPNFQLDPSFFDTKNPGSFERVFENDQFVVYKKLATPA